MGVRRYMMRFTNVRGLTRGSSLLGQAMLCVQTIALSDRLHHALARGELAADVCAIDPADQDILFL